MTKIGQIYKPHKFAQSSGIPPILAHKGSQTTRATPGDYLAPGNRKPIGQRNCWKLDRECHVDFCMFLTPPHELMKTQKRKKNEKECVKAVLYIVILEYSLYSKLSCCIRFIQEPPGVNYYGLRFRGKSNPLQTFFFFFLSRLLSGALWRTTQ